MTECQLCGAKSQLFLCRKHTDELQDMLNGLPRWLRYLRDTALRQTRIGSDSRIRRTRGDEMPGLFEPDAEDHRPGKPHLTKQGRASELLDEVTNTLGTWIRHLCEQRGYPPPKLDDPRSMARQLGVLVGSIATDPGAEQCYAEIDHAIAEIEAVINRPEPKRWVGPCPHFDDDGTQCGFVLRADRDATHVRCAQCRTTHDVRAVTERYLNRARNVLLTLPQIGVLLAQIEEPVPDRTLRHWAQRNRLRTRGWIRPSGRHGITRHGDDDIPGYWLDDARKLRAEAERKAGTT